jgi:5-methylcytosine-specific restriction endonuclease McrA
MSSCGPDLECPLCGFVSSGLGQLRLLEADHILAWSKGGLTTWENMQLLCRACNRQKHSMII